MFKQKKIRAQVKFLNKNKMYTQTQDTRQLDMKMIIEKQINRYSN